MVSQIDRDSARCELERLLKTAGTQDKKKKIISALDRLEVGFELYTSLA